MIKSYMIYFFLVLISAVLKLLAIMIPILLAVAFITLAERKVLGAVQRRRGPNVVGIFGIFQPLADGIKLIFKETLIPGVSNKIVFTVAPILTLFFSAVSWVVVPFGKWMVAADINLGVLYILAVSTLNVYGIILSGWASNSRYSFLGCLRSAAQMISYEVSIGIIMLTTLMCVGSLQLSDIVDYQKHVVWLIFPMLPSAIMFFISALAETNRPPFDLPEAEAELVSGYNVEYSAIGFALFFIGEYSNLIFMGSITTTFFLGGWLPPFGLESLEIFGPLWFGLKTALVVFSFIWVRASLPRYRYDQLMRLGWKVLLPLGLAWAIFTAAFLYTFDVMAPYHFPSIYSDVIYYDELPYFTTGEYEKNKALGRSPQPTDEFFKIYGRY
jgi:NADH-quinone oxidoreductase subunit H